MRLLTFAELIRKCIAIINGDFHYVIRCKLYTFIFAVNEEHLQLTRFNSS